MPSTRKEKKVIGWREWVTFPDLKIDKIKAKIDTGARTSSLHAFGVKVIEKDGKEFVRFKVHPQQKSTKVTIEAEVEIHEYRLIKSSNGHQQKRPVIITPMTIFDTTWDIELTLANRDEMGFRMLLGREGMRKRLIVDPSKSYLSSKN